MMNKIKVKAEENYKRADAFVPLISNISRSYAEKIFERGLVFKNGKVITKKDKILVGDTLEITIPDAEPMAVEAENIPLDIIFEDKYLLVVNKPKGMVVHPAPGNYSGTLVNALLYYCKDELSGINGVLRPGIVHRIDKDTSGLLMVAKTDIAHKGLAEQIKDHSFNREYRAIVYGNIKDNKGEVNAPIGRHPLKRKQMTVTINNSRPARTNYEVIERLDGFTYINLKLYTGRTHQIRVHMAYIGHPVAGDSVYGPKKCITELHGQCLHARLIGFNHPISGEYMEFISEPPEYFNKFLEKVRPNGQI